MGHEDRGPERPAHVGDLRDVQGHVGHPRRGAVGDRQRAEPRAVGVAHLLNLGRERGLSGIAELGDDRQYIPSVLASEAHEPQPFTPSTKHGLHRQLRRELRPRPHRRPLEPRSLDGLQGLQHGNNVRVAGLSILLGRPTDDRDQCAGQVANLLLRVALRGRQEGEEPSTREDVRAGIHPVGVGPLLGSAEVHLAEPVQRAGQLDALRAAGDPEVEQLDVPVSVHHHVLRGDVPVHDPERVHAREPAKHLLHHAEHFGERRAGLLHAGTERLTFHVLQDDCVAAVGQFQSLEDLHDVRVVDLPHQLELAAEPSLRGHITGQRLRQHLHRDSLAVFTAAGKENPGVSASPKRGLKVIAGDERQLLPGGGPQELRRELGAPRIGRKKRVLGRQRPRCREARGLVLASA